MCWVMPPASPATTLVLRIASSSVVLPWSTWPITVTTGGRGTASMSSSSSSSSKNLACSAASCCSPGSTSRTEAPISAANSSIMSSVSAWDGGHDLALEEQEADDVGRRSD